MTTEEKTEETTEAPAAPAPAAPRPPSAGASNPLSRPTDFVVRPGFRNPANTRSKAQKKKGRRK